MTEATVSAVSLKLPTFWPERVEVWFAQAEAQFAIRGITSDATRFHYIVQALDQDTATRVLDLLLHPPEEDKYKTLKQRLLDSLTLSESQRASCLLSMPGIGDGKPSHLMDKMLALLGQQEPCFIFREIFMQQLPAHIRAHLIQAKITDCREMSLAADALWSVNYANNISAVSSISTSKVKHTQVIGKPKSGLCYFHERFGDAARQCRPPCNFKAQGNSSAGRH